MSGLLKAGDRTAQAAVQRLGAVPLTPRKRAAAPGKVSPDPVPEIGQTRPGPPPDRVANRNEELDRQCMELEAQVAELRHLLQEAEDSAAERASEALEKGRREGREQAESGERRRLDALAAALAELPRDLRERLDDCELLALQLARTAISRIFGERRELAELVSATLAHHLAGVKADLLVGVRVSPADFPDDAAIAALADDHGGIAVRPDAGLEAGECEIDLKLGKVDIGLDGQWRRLCEYFDTLAGEEPRG